MRHLLADDKLCHHNISSKEDQKTLKDNVHKLGKREETWRISFNTDKFETLTIICKRSPLPTEYSLHKKLIETVKEAHYLGVTITQDLRWEIQRQQQGKPKVRTPEADTQSSFNQRQRAGL